MQKLIFERVDNIIYARYFMQDPRERWIYKVL
jgi:hypothetical protein